HHFEGLSGRLEGTITTETPLFVKKGKTDTFFAVNGHKAIPGSALKGLFRSVVETVAQGCFCLFDGKYRSRSSQGGTVNSDYSALLPPPFKRCSPEQHTPAEETPLCTACRLFGVIESRRFGHATKTVLRLGNVSFSDAICAEPTAHDAIYTAILSSPKPHHDAFYCDGTHIAGRKFYYHHRNDNLLTANGWLPPRALHHQNQHIQPVGVGSTFAFAADFSNVEGPDFAALLYALVLEPEMRHKVGYAKPCGLGTVRVELTKLTFWDAVARYREGADQEVYDSTTDPSVSDILSDCMSTFVGTIPPSTLSDLRRVWRWPPATGVDYRYPTPAQF
ncbi:MAG: hypothetical protein COZ05_19050, partial [Armatimonadetes bacterium CG_4_10_14_3_um_filter_59_10]